jgi:hypothetical protein
MKLKTPRPDFFEVVENIAMYGGFIAIVLLIILNLVSYV